MFYKPTSTKLAMVHANQTPSVYVYTHIKIFIYNSIYTNEYPNLRICIYTS